MDKALDGPRLRKDPLGWLNYQHESRILEDFRFRKAELLRMFQALDLPVVVRAGT